MLIALIAGQLHAAEVKIDFNAMDVPVSSSDSEAGNIDQTWTYSLNGITISVSPKDEEATNPNRFWATGNGPQLRCYSGTITISAAEAITKIEVGSSKLDITPNTGSLEGNTWTGSASEVVFTVNKNSQINNFVVTTGEGGGETPQTETVDIAGFKALERGTEATLKLVNAQVLYATGNDIFVRDASGAIDFFRTDLNYDNNQILNGTIVGMANDFNNMPELVKGDNFAADVTVTDGAMAQAVELTIAQADMSHACDLILLKGLTLRKDGNYWYGDVDGTSIQVYDKFKLGYTPEEGKTYDITGILVPYKENFEICPIVDFTSGQQPEPQTGDILNESFLETLGAFTIDDGELPAGIEYVWKQDSRYGATASAYVEGVKYATNAWLISPELDLSGYTGVKLSFEHTGKFFGNMEKEAALWVKVLDDANDWTKVTIPTYMTGNDWTFVESIVDLSAYDGKKIQFAFVYTSTAEYAATWEVKNVKVTGDVVTTISNIEGTKQTGLRYNLSGQRVDNSYKGVVIEDGKKFVVR